jgi:hypothetical protein
MSLLIKTLQEVNNGNAMRELDDAMQSLVEKVRETKAGGEIQLRIKIKPAKSDAEMVEVKSDMSLKLPKFVRQPSLFYTTEDNNLERNDPRQKLMDLRVVESPETQTAPRRVANA